MQTPRNIFLLYSIEEEFIKKIENEISQFSNKLNRFLDKGEMKVETINKNWGKLSKFEEYIFNLIDEEGLNEIGNSDFLVISFKYRDSLIEAFDELTNDWIKAPSAKSYGFIKTSREYKMSEKKISQYIHYPDSKHIALALIEIKKRKIDHDFVFLTKDSEWLGIDDKLGIKNFKIINPSIRPVFIGKQSRRIYALKILEILNDGHSCVIQARGYYINTAVSTCLYLQNTLLPSMEIQKIILDSEVKGERRISNIKIYVSN